jgi:NAD(P)-dependent dehydrogenase (short-subunit alcohol dehydrogenase family)
MTRLRGRVVAVTGGSAGIGRATAQQLAIEGAAVAVSARRAHRLDEVVAAIVANGGRALAVPGDVTSELDMRALVARTVETFGRLDVMICNAGIGFHDTFERTSSEVMRRVVDVNLMGTFYAAQAAMEAFLPQNTGHVIAVSSVVGRRGMAGSAVYSATKAAQIGFIESLRAEFLGTGLRASVIYPVSTETEFHEALRRDFGRQVRPLGPRQSADQVARAIVECVISPSAEVYPLKSAWWLSVLSVVAPAKADRVVQKWGRKVER